MKWSIIVTVLILFAGSFFSWQQHTEVRRLEEVVQVLSIEAENLGTNSEELLSSNRVGHQREDRSARVRVFLGKLIDFAKLQKEMKDNPSPEFREQMMVVLGELAELSAMDLKELVTQMQSHEGMDDDTRNGMLAFCVMMLINDSPRSALELLAQTDSALQKNRGMADNLLSTALGKWAAEDPQAALAWMRENEKRFPNLAKDDQKIKMIQVVAQSDMTLTLSLLDEVVLKDDNGESFRRIVGMTSDAAGADAILAKWRSIDANDEKYNVYNSALQELGQSTFFNDFEKATAWFNESDLSEREASEVTLNIQYSNIKNDVGKWLNWMDAKLDEKSAKHTTKQMIPQWTNQDHRAVGEWLNEQKDGDMKNTAIESYAETLAPHEPAIAAEWVETLPEGKIRERALQGVYRRWAAQDEAAGKAFAEKHGLKK